MKVRITFRSEVILEGDTLGEVSSKWEGLPIFSTEALDNGAEFIETVSVEDADTFEDIMSEFENA